MRVYIQEERKISDIQQDFTKLFPYLKLEFFTYLHRATEGSPKKNILSSAKTLSECRTYKKDGTITIVPSMTVADLERNVRSNYGLSVQVFRKSGKAWLETTMTDMWTLEEQNKQGESLSSKLYRA